MTMVGSLAVNLYRSKIKFTWEKTQVTPIGSSGSSILAPRHSFLFIITLLLNNVELEILTILSFGVFEPLGLLLGVKLPVCPLFFTGVLSEYTSSLQR